MAFLRVKRSRGRSYAYLVENAWDPSRQQPRQKVIRYLGRLDGLRAEQLPVRYRTAPILRAIERYVHEDRRSRSGRAANHLDPFLRAILEGDRPSALRLARRVSHEAGPEYLREEVVKAALYEVGERWADGKLTVSQEHLATGIVAQVLSEVNARIRSRAESGSVVLLCVPEGEEHTMPLLFAEGLLRRKGFQTHNLGGSAPTGEVVAYAAQTDPAAVLISVTEPQRLGRARTLAAALRERLPRARVVIGGQGTQGAAPRSDLRGVEVAVDSMESYLGSWSPAPTPTGRSGPPRR
jgi:methanogenic corrinoid protein MtbC1